MLRGVNSCRRVRGELGEGIAVDASGEALWVVTILSGGAGVVAFANIDCAGAPLTQVGSSFDDDFYGTAGPDVVDLGAGDDIYDGAEGDDIVCGRDGDDQIHGGVGDFRDSLYGGPGADTMLGGFGIDYIWGDDGDDEIHGDGGFDRLRGNGGNDHLRRCWRRSRVGRRW